MHLHHSRHYFVPMYFSFFFSLCSCISFHSLYIRLGFSLPRVHQQTYTRVNANNNL